MDCSDSEVCKKETRVIFPRSDLRDMIILACWGVYCKSGQAIRYKVKNEKIIPSQVELGQTYVFKGIYENVKDDRVSDIFFAGDNVYRYGYDLNEEYKEPREFDMKRQLESFETCYEQIKPHVSRTFIAIGNHDIETCDILNEQLNYNGWQQTGVYYSVRYMDMDHNHAKRNVTIVVLDTNMYEEKAKKCNGAPFSDVEIQKQEEFVMSECQLAKENNDWLIVIGHIPAIATGHGQAKKEKKEKSDKEKEKKEKKDGIENDKLLALLKRCSPHLYVCGDEHNQQFIYQDNISFAVVGSGGTDLDTMDQKKIDGTFYSAKKFGFLRLSFENETLDIIFNTSFNDELTTRTCKIKLNYNRIISSFEDCD